MTDWTIKLPVRDPDEIVTPRTAIELPSHLPDDKDAATCHQLFLFALEAAGGSTCSVGQVEAVIESFDQRERQDLLDALRIRAGLPRRSEVEARQRFDAAQMDARIRMSEQAPRIQICAAEDCTAVVADPITHAPTTSDVRKWWCPTHRHLAAEGDMEPPELRVRVSPVGLYELVDEVDEAREANREARELARRAAERDQRQREHEAESEPEPPMPVADNLRDLRVGHR